MMPIIRLDSSARWLECTRAPCPRWRALPRDPSPHRFSPTAGSEAAELLSSAEEHVVNLTKLWLFNEREMISSRLGSSDCSASRRPLASCGTRNLHDVVELDLTSLTALERLPQDRNFSLHILSSTANPKLNFTWKKNKNNPQSIVLQKKKIENVNCF